jgi:predicted RND superfamily exporter protein
MTKTRTQVLLGLGVDDSFVLMEVFRRTSVNDDIVKRSATGMGHAGTSILITSLTDFVAFMISSTSAFPALKSFCVYAGIGIILLFWFQISVFAPSIVIDELWRRLKGRRDVLCCCSHSSSRRKKSVSKKKKTTTTDDTTTPPQTTLAPNALIRFMDKKYVVFERGVRVFHSCLYLTLHH